VLGALRAAAAGPLAGVLDITDDDLVSSDIVGNPHSAIVDASNVTVLGGHLVRVLAWYDNEWAFSVRMLDIARILGGSA
jgi:glyceraldehyde-3-phosphate dehydrogenase/erythrose-4-phosphate dehydrogenase